jgi:hypothetical protein
LLGIAFEPYPPAIPYRSITQTVHPKRWRILGRSTQREIDSNSEENASARPTLGLNVALHVNANRTRRLVGIQTQITVQHVNQQLIAKFVRSDSALTARFSERKHITLRAG